MSTAFNSNLDLTFERIIDVPPHLVWRAWTEPQLIKQWFCPLPWKTVDAEVDVRPGGIFRTTMQSPEGKAFPNTGCYLETVKKRAHRLDQCHVARLSPRAAQCALQR